MKYLFVMVILSGALAGPGSTARSVAQEHKHEERKEESKTPATKTTEASKGDGMKCCEGMEKMGEMKGDMKAKMEKMKAMKEKIAEKMKGMEGMKMKDMKNDAKSGEPNKDAHQH